ncbi:hypothetical protein HY502_01305 [Candidatus Woesebacteria bacterium]|nr:hypothetical protein [Candidatus Woesebacteria bacterium]
MSEGGEFRPIPESLNPKDLEYLFEVSKFPSIPGLVDLSKAKKAIDNSARGWIGINREGGFSYFISFNNLIDKKKALIEKMVREIEAGRNETLDLLWDIAVSPRVGLDLNRWTLSKLSSFSPLPKEFLDKMAGRLKSDISKEKYFAAQVLVFQPGYFKTDKKGSLQLAAPALKANNYTPSVLVDRARKFGKGYGKSLNSWASLEAYRNLLPYYEEGKVDVDSPALRREISSKIANKISKATTSERKKRYPSRGVSLGIEIQGITEESVPGVAETEEKRFTLFGKEDYQELGKAANFYDSPDEYFEFSTRPSFSPLEISLIVQTLNKMGVMNVEEGVVSLDVNLGKLRFEGENFREPMILQLIMLAADYSNVPESTSSDDSWEIAIRAKPERFSERGAASLEGQKIRSYTELRLFAIKDLTNLYETLINIKELGDLAYEKQEGKLGNDFNSRDAVTWELLVLDAVQLFKKEGFPSPTERWKYRDLKRLSSYASSSKGSDFVRNLRSLIKKARARKRRGDETENINSMGQGLTGPAKEQKKTRAKMVEEGGSHRITLKPSKPQT